MKMSNADILTYPKFAKYVRYELHKVAKVPAIARAFQTIGQLNSVSLKNALKWGQGPDIKITALVGALGEFTADSHSNEIRIKTHLVQDFEAGLDLRLVPGGQAHLAGVTLLHELVHWGDDQDGVDRAGEEGEEFETTVYGSVIN
jgi:hypothetical protein